jgi:hypothetical protein
MTRFRLLLSVVFAAVSLGAQAQTTVADKWTPPRARDGHPDLQGIWTTQTFTPLQRPERYAGREFLTDDEVAELTRILTQDGVDPLAGNVFGVSDEERDKRIHQTDKTHYNNADWLTTSQPKALSSRRTSLIFDPPDGRIPPLTPEGQRRVAARRAAAGFDSYENLPIQQRCIIWTHEGPPMLPPPYNDVYQIVQASDYVVVVRELAGKQARIIPTDGRPHVSEQVRQWGGDSRGHWEGDTLVVETTNFKEEAAIQGSSAALRVIERFRRVSADQILYQFTVEDPTTWTRPWSAEIPMMKTDGPVYEYACHEGNYSLENTLRGARVREKKAAEGTARKDPK